MKLFRRTAQWGVLRVLLLMTGLCVGFYAYRLHELGEMAFSYLPWNLFLAWIPLLLTVWLGRMLRRRAWSSWPALLLTLLWLLFLPNSFYLVSDYIHLQELISSNILFDAVMFTLFVLTGFILGYTSLYLFHLQLLKRMRVVSAGRLIGLILLACSIAIYIGRDLRWNSWDVLTSPAGLLFDLSDQLTRTSNYATMAGTVVIFFALLAGVYYTGWQLLSYAKRIEPRDV